MDWKVIIAILVLVLCGMYLGAMLIFNYIFSKKHIKETIVYALEQYDEMFNK